MAMEASLLFFDFALSQLYLVEVPANDRLCPAPAIEVAEVQTQD
jgi:hypothetical protein